MKRIVLDPITQEKSVITSDEMKHIFGGSGDEVVSDCSGNLGKQCKGMLDGHLTIGVCAWDGDVIRCMYSIDSSGKDGPK
ncbi:MAG: hypothetical protein IJ699_00100 [Bacteroidaceae bacterium]|nr:hypothetical protein [Bacteroidaceae bacterium]